MPRIVGSLISGCSWLLLETCSMIVSRAFNFSAACSAGSGMVIASPARKQTTEAEGFDRVERYEGRREAGRERHGGQPEDRDRQRHVYGEEPHLHRKGRH